MIIILNQAFEKQGVIRNTISSNHTEELSGEHTLEFECVLDYKTNALITDNSVFMYNGQYFDIGKIIRTAEENGSFLLKVDAEHISYRLNATLYNLEYFTKIGTMEEIFTEILKDTPFTMGTVHFGTPTGTQTSGVTIAARVDEAGDIIIYGWTIGVDVTAGIYYKTAVFDAITGKVTYGTPSGIINADTAFTGGYFYLPDTIDPEHKYIKLKTLVGSDITYEVWELRIAYSIQEKKSRRATVVEFAAYCYAELVFNNFTISIVEHIGDSVSKPTIFNRNVSFISKEVDKRQLDKDGNPTIVYSCTPIFTPVLSTYELGDNIILIQSELGIREDLRVVSISKDPYDVTSTVLKFSNYHNGLAESVYRTETTNVVKDKMYNGTRIGPQFGFENIRADKRARSFFRADGLRFQSGPATNLNAPTPIWKNRLYFEYEDITDPDNSDLTLKFNGVLDSEVIVTPNLYADNGNIANLTVGKLETSTKISRYLYQDESPVYFIKITGQNIQFIEAYIPSTGYGTRIIASGYYDMINVDPFTDDFYSSIIIDQVTLPTGGKVTFGNGEISDAWTAINNGRIYRVVVGETNQFIKLTAGTSDFKVLYDKYETYPLGYSAGKIGEGAWDISNGTSAVYYKGFSINTTSGIVTYIDPSEIIGADAAFALDYIYRPDGDTPTTKYKKITSIFPFNDTIYISWDEYQTSRAYDKEEQFKNNEGAFCYWINSSKKIMTTTVSDFPVMIFKYNENIKMEQTFTDRNGFPTPMINMGIGTGVGDNGKGRIIKDSTGMHFEYASSIDGTMRSIALTDEGIVFDPPSTGDGGGHTFSDTEPVSPTLHEIWINTLNDTAQYWTGSTWKMLLSITTAPGIYSSIGLPLLVNNNVPLTNVKSHIIDVCITEILSEIVNTENNNITFTSIGSNITSGVTSIVIT